MFGEKGVGVEMDVPGLGEPKELKGKFKSSGYGDLKESKYTYVLLDKGEEISKSFGGIEPRANKEYNLKESKLRKVIRESIEKELAAINKEAELEVLSSKLEKIEAAIEKRNSQLSKLDEDEDMKALTDKKKIKSLEKDIKTLEKAKAKIEKQLSKVSKKNKDVNVAKKEVIDEDTLNEIDPKGIEAATNATGEMDKNFKNIASTISKIELEEGETIDIKGIIKKKYKNIPNEDIKSFINMHSQDIETEEDVMYQFEEFLTANPEILNIDEGENELSQEIINQIIPMYAEEGMEIEDIASMYPEMYNEVVEFLEGYDLGLDYDI
jgi:hypothetical protein